ncbi:hypothetical protein [Verrucomicrobium spinosum]|uniref:hypothetical protein n=1 Tax=Verrucomicrobium spinosum TaxID=2736 RepID=UPI0012E27189|nr:hypothetical protein [Verrucomicrobium spinosum]
MSTAESTGQTSSRSLPSRIRQSTDRSSIEADRLPSAKWASIMLNRPLAVSEVS